MTRFNNILSAMVSTSFEGGGVTDDECGEVGGDLRRLPAVLQNPETTTV